MIRQMIQCKDIESSLELASPPLRGRRRGGWGVRTKQGATVETHGCHLNGWAELIGAYVIGGLAMSRGKLPQHTEEFAARLHDALTAT